MADQPIRFFAGTRIRMYRWQSLIIQLALAISVGWHEGKKITNPRRVDGQVA